MISNGEQSDYLQKVSRERAQAAAEITGLEQTIGNQDQYEILRVTWYDWFIRLTSRPRQNQRKLESRRSWKSQSAKYWNEFMIPADMHSSLDKNDLCIAIVVFTH
jgi:hypothetical protein